MISSKKIYKIFFLCLSLSPNIDNSSETGSESTSPESSSEESNNGLAKVENNHEKNKWCLSSYVLAKSTQPSQDSQPTVTNIKHEPNVIDDDNDLMYTGQIMPNSINPIKDLYQQQQTITNNYDSKSQHSQNNCDLIVDTIKQEPPGKSLCVFPLDNLFFVFVCFCFDFFWCNPTKNSFSLVAAKSPSKSPEKLPSVDPFESDEIESVLAEAKELNQIKPVSSLSGE